MEKQIPKVKWRGSKIATFFTVCGSMASWNNFKNASFQSDDNPITIIFNAQWSITVHKNSFSLITTLFIVLYWESKNKKYSFWIASW